MGRLERHLDQQKVEQLLATGKFEQPRTYPKQDIVATPSRQWPTPAYRAKIERKQRARLHAIAMTRTRYAATGR